MRFPRSRAAVLVAALSLGTALVSGCGLQSAGTVTSQAAPAAIRPTAAVVGEPITVGAKNFTEALILGKIAVIALQVAGFEVTDRSGIPGAAPARAAMTGGEVHVQWDYTGTGWLNYLGMPEGIPDRQEQWRALKEADAENGMTWLPPADVFAEITPLLTDEVMIELNGRVDVDGEDPADVALDWMVSEGLVARG